MVFSELYQYREMIRSLVRRDLVGRYKKSFLGFLWTFVDPLMQLIVYTFVFTVIMPVSNIEHFYLHLFVALIPWNFYSSCLAGGCMCIINQQDMVKKIYFPREILPISYVTSQFVNMALSFIVVFAVLLISGTGINPVVIWCIIPVMLIQYMLCIGVTLLTSAITVYFRDLQQILSVVTLALMYASPVIYSVDMVPESIRAQYMFNPMSALIVSYRDILYYKRFPDGRYLLQAGITSLIVLLAGYFAFNNMERRFVEEL